MRKILIGILLLIGWSAQAQYQQINNGESGLSVRNKLNTMHQQLYNLNVTTQYSSDNASWHSEYAVGDQYIRFSTDLGTTWTDGILISDNIEFQDSINMNSNRIKNLEAAIDANDAVNLQQMLDSLAQVTGADSVRYSWDGDGYLKTYVLGSVTDSTLIDGGTLTIKKTGTLSELGTFAAHDAHISTPYIAAGGEITDNGNGTITISAGEVSIKTDNLIHSEFIAIHVPEITLAITAEQNIILYVDYNNGSPMYAAMQSVAGYFYSNWDKIPFATVINIGSKIIINDFKDTPVNGVYKNTLSQLNYQPIRYLGGLASAEVGTRQLSVSGGALLLSNDYAGVPGINTSTGDTFTRMYVTNGVWTRQTGQSVVSNTQYNDITTGLATLTASPERWANKWLFYIIDSPNFWVLLEGQTAYTSLAAAESGGIPSVLPPEVSQFYAGAILVSKIIVSGAETNFVSIQNPFVQTFQTTAASSHNNLSDLQFSAPGVSYGHINDQVQTIDGQKSFLDSPIIPVASPADSTTKAASTSWVLREISTHQVAYTDSAAVTAVTNVLSDADDLVWNYTQTLPQSISATVKDDSHNHIIGNIDGLQAALDGKQVTITGAASTIDTENLTGNRALISNSSGKVAVSSTVSDTELGYLDGVTSGVQAQLYARQLLTDTVTYDATRYYVDTEVAASVANAVTAASPFGADNRIVITDGTGRGTKVSSASFSGDDVSFVGGGTFGGNVDIASTNNNSTSPLQVTNNGVNSFLGAFKATAPNMAAGQTMFFEIGKANSTYNSASLQFKYIGNSDPTNLLSLSFFGNNNLLNVQGIGNVGIGYSSGTEINNNKLAVNGSVYASGTATAAPATLSTHLLQKGQVEDGSLDADFNTVSVGGSLTGQWLANGSDIYYNGGNVGIGTNTPDGILDVRGATPSVAVIQRNITTADQFIYGSARLKLSATTPSVNSGVGFYFSSPNVNNDDIISGLFGARHYDISLGNEKSEIVIQAAYQNLANGTSPHLIVKATSTSTGDVIAPNGNINTSGAYQLGSSTVQVEKDGSNNMLFTDAFNTDVSLSDLKLAYDWVNTNTEADSVNIAGAYKIGNNVKISKNANDSLLFSDLYNTEVSLSQLLTAGASPWSSDANGITYSGNIGVNGPSSSSVELNVTGDGDFSGSLDVGGTFEAFGLTVMYSTNGVRFKELSSTPATPSNSFGAFYAGSDGNPYYINDGGVVSQLNAAGSGTVTSVAAGSGMNFSTITTTGTVAMGTPSSITSTSINQATGTTHSHALGTQAVQSSNLNNNVISGLTATSTVVSTDEMAISDAGLIRKIDVVDLKNYFNSGTQSLSGTTPTLNVNSGLHATITLTGNTTITMSNLVSGMSGNIRVTNAATAYTIQFSGVTTKIAPSLNSSAGVITMSGSSENDVLSWWYDGTNLYINGTLAYD